MYPKKEVMPEEVKYFCSISKCWSFMTYVKHLKIIFVL